jgi:hypothetical protein
LEGVWYLGWIGYRDGKRREGLLFVVIELLVFVLEPIGGGWICRAKRIEE